MQKTKSTRKTVRKVLLFMLLIVVLVIGGFFSFLFLGKEKAINLKLDGISLQPVENGVYTGSYDDFRWSNTVEVTVKDHRIADIRVVKSQVFIKNETVNELTERVLSKQNTDVDAISGASADSKAFLKAVENALKLPSTAH